MDYWRATVTFAGEAEDRSRESLRELEEARPRFGQGPGPASDGVDECTCWR
jgi:hypothetical protein